MTGDDRFDRLPAQQPQSPADDRTVTRSDEELDITTHRRESGRARLVKYVETETVVRTIPVRREQTRIEYAPAVEDAGDLPTGAGGAEARWMVLYEEEVVVRTRWVARERVRLSVHAVVEQREVTETLRAERVEIDDGDRVRRGQRLPTTGDRSTDSADGPGLRDL